MTNGKVAVALVGGYLLGRTKKAKLAIGMGMFLAGKKVSLNPQQLAKMAANSPVLSGLNDQVRNELVDATKSAATKALTNRANSLANALHDRTLTLQDSSRPSRDAESEDETDAEAEVRDDEAVTADEGKPRRTSASSRTRKSSTSSRTRKTSSGGDSRTASGRSRTATSGSRKTANESSRSTRRAA